MQYIQFSMLFTLLKTFKKTVTYIWLGFDRSQKSLWVRRSVAKFFPKKIFVREGGGGAFSEIDMTLNRTVCDDLPTLIMTTPCLPCNVPYKW